MSSIYRRPETYPVLLMHTEWFLPEYKFQAFLMKPAVLHST